MIKTKNGIPVATDFVRIVHGERGSFVEFTKDQILLKTISIPQNAKWRFSQFWLKIIYYFEYRTTDNISVYYQKKLVSYADYKLKHYYIAVEDLDLDLNKNKKKNKKN